MEFSLKSKNTNLLIVFSFIVFYAFFFMTSDLGNFSYQLNKINFSYVIPILFLGVIAMIIRSIRQKLFFDSLDIKMSIKKNIIIYFAGLSMTTTPGGLGQSIKSYFLKNKYNHPYTKTLTITLFERYYELLGAITIISMALLLKESFEGFVVVSILTPVLLSVLVVVKNEKLFSKLISIIPKKSFLKKIDENQGEFFNNAKILTNKRNFVLGWGLGFVSWLFIALAFYLSFLAFNLPHNFLDSIIINFVPGVIGVISLLPGGIGLTEFGMLGLLLKSGIDISVSSALILFIRFTTMWAYTIMGIIFSQYFIRNKSNP